VIFAPSFENKSSERSLTEFTLSAANGFEMTGLSFRAKREEYPRYFHPLQAGVKLMNHFVVQILFTLIAASPRLEGSKGGAIFTCAYRKLISY